MTQYNPDEVSHPGETLIEMINERAWTVSDLAQKSGIDFNTLNSIVEFSAPITRDIAAGLERAFSAPPARFWLNRQRHYDGCELAKATNRRIGEVLGYRLHDDIKSILLTPDGYGADACYESVCYRDEHWNLQEEMRMFQVEDGWELLPRWAWDTDVALSLFAGEWDIKIWLACDIETWFCKPDCNAMPTSAPTPAMAICLAWLEFKEKDSGIH